MFKSSASSSSKTKKTKVEVSGVNESMIESFFNSYADEEDPDIITMDGISQLSEQLGMDPSSDVRLLGMLWRLGAVSKPGLITKVEFSTGMKSLRKDSLKGMLEVLPSFDPGFLDRTQFREFYRFVFQFSRADTHKTIEKDMIVGLLPIVLDASRAPHLPLFLEFLKQSTTHTRITLDQWDSFLQFQYIVRLDLVGYDNDSAWPLLLDEYVEWRREKK